MSNPVMERVRADLTKTTPAGYPQMPGYQVGGTRGQDTGLSEASPSLLNDRKTEPGQRGQTSASVPMTFDDVLIRTGFSFLVLVAGATAGWVISDSVPRVGSILLIAGPILGLIFVMLSAFRGRPSAVLTLGYAIAEGVFLGTFSQVLEKVFPGIVLQALFATAAVFLTCFALYKFGLVKVNSRFTKIMLVGVVSILVYSVIDLGFTWFTGGALSSATFLGIPLGFIVGVLAIIFGAMSLIDDFNTAYLGVKYGAPREMSWSCALGMMVSVVWLYVEILNILRYFQDESV